MLEYLDALPDMRISGVPGVPGVTARKTAIFCGTPRNIGGVPGVPRTPDGNTWNTRSRPVQAERCSAQHNENTNEIRDGTPGTRGTPKKGNDPGWQARVTGDRTALPHRTWLDHPVGGAGAQLHVIDQDAGDPAADTNFMRGGHAGSARTIF